MKTCRVAATPERGLDPFLGCTCCCCFPQQWQQAAPCSILPALGCGNARRVRAGTPGSRAEGTELCPSPCLLPFPPDTVGTSPSLQHHSNTFVVLPSAEMSPTGISFPDIVEVSACPLNNSCSEELSVSACFRQGRVCACLVKMLLPHASSVPLLSSTNPHLPVSLSGCCSVCLWRSPSKAGSPVCHRRLGSGTAGLVLNPMVMVP